MGHVESLDTGRRLRQAGRWAEAHESLELALAERETAAAHGELGAVAWWLGEVRESLRHRERAYALYAADGDVARAAMVAIDISICYLTNLDNHAAAHGWIARAHDVGRRAGHDVLAGWLWLVDGYTARDPAVGDELLTRALDFARDAEDCDLELVALADLGLARVAAGEVAGGLALLDEAMAGTLGGGFDRLETVVWTSCSMLAACGLVGDLQRAAAWCGEADRFMERYGCPFLQARCRAHYGRLLVATGQWELAESELGTAVGMTDVGRGPLAEALTGLADLRLRQGRAEEAGELLREVDQEPVAVPVAAAWHRRCGRPERAVALLAEQLTGLEDAAPGAPPLRAALVEALVATGDLAAAEREAARLSSSASAHGHPAAPALASYAAGLVARAEGRPQEAELHLRAAATGFGSLDLPYEQAEARLERARTVAGHSPQLAVVEADRALQRARSLGALDLAANAAALLRTLGVAAPPGRRGAGVLSGREREVLVLLEQGLTNPQIGERLFISRKTVAHHVSSILAKLGLSSRAEAAAFAARDRLERRSAGSAR